MQIKIDESLSQLIQSDNRFSELFNNSLVSLELYKPVREDLQAVHDREEIYIIAAGSGTFYLEDTMYNFEPADFFYVPAGKNHRFSDFTGDFCTWVIFLNNPPR
jgi:mannose-6-phosphate isomerase-like protein (cupin superfamily)